MLCQEFEAKSAYQLYFSIAHLLSQLRKKTSRFKLQAREPEKLLLSPKQVQAIGIQASID